jgi:hypothetical protein
MGTLEGKGLSGKFLCVARLADQEKGRHVDAAVVMLDMYSEAD